MATKLDLKEWIVEALKAHAGDLFYTWQHEVLWALDDLRKEGKLLPKPKGHKGPCRLAG